jgi:hypothetical protein
VQVVNNNQTHWDGPIFLHSIGWREKVESVQSNDGHNLLLFAAIPSISAFSGSIKGLGGEKARRIRFQGGIQSSGQALFASQRISCESITRRYAMK